MSVLWHQFVFKLRMEFANGESHLNLRMNYNDHPTYRKTSSLQYVSCMVIVPGYNLLTLLGFSLLWKSREGRGGVEAHWLKSLNR